MVAHASQIGVVTVAAWLAAGAPAGAADPVAVIQEITATGAGFEFLDYVSEGDTITLQANDRLVLGYFASCIEETVSGGTVRIGIERSDVDGGSVARRTVNCDGGDLALSERQVARSGVVVFRKGAQPSAIDAPSARLYGASPLIRSDIAGTLALSRLDAPAQTLSFDLTGGRLDLAAAGIVLAPGGIYRAELRSGETVRIRIFEVDAFAPPGDTPVVGRLLRM